jgi:hypothetical protein
MQVRIYSCPMKLYIHSIVYTCVCAHEQIMLYMHGNSQDQYSVKSFVNLYLHVCVEVCYTCVYKTSYNETLYTHKNTLLHIHVCKDRHGNVHTIEINHTWAIFLSSSSPFLWIFSLNWLRQGFQIVFQLIPSINFCILVKLVQEVVLSYRGMA